MKKKITQLFFTFLLFSPFIYSQDNIITIDYKRNKDNSVDFFYKKNVPGNYTLSLKFTNVFNTMTKSVNEILKSSGGKIISLKPINPNQGITYSYKFSYIMGEVNPKVDSAFVYLVPFKKGITFKAYEQDFVGEKYFGNDAPKNWKSYQFTTSENDTIYAARKGIVIKVVNEFDNDSLSYYYTSKKNELLIEHEDGTIGSYIGFKKDGFFLKLGEIVYPQTPIGIANLDLKQNIFKISFRVYFLTNPSFDSREKETLFNKIHRHQFVAPYFLTSEGITPLISRKKYTSEFNQEILFKEMSKREIKKYHQANQ